MSIIIGADIVPVHSNTALFKDAKTEQLISGELRQILQSADYRVFNLEVPLTDRQQPIAKQGPNLIADTACAAGIKALGADLLTLANNHIMDQDAQGLASTVSTLDRMHIAHVGAGNGLQEAQKPYFFTVQGKKYGVYACAEHEFSIAGSDTPGANPFDPLESPDHVRQMKAQCDYAIVLYHGGKEHYRYPSPSLQKACRKLVEKGADLVVCQHSHCIGCEEKYLQGTILYGQGNFLFDAADNEFWNTSLLVQIEEHRAVSYIPLCKDGRGVRLAKGKEADEILEGLRRRSEEIKQPGCIAEKYKAFAEKNIENYVLYLTGKKKNVLFKIVNRLTGRKLQQKAAKRYMEKNGTAVRNFIECEAHRELLLRGLEKNAE